LGDEAPVRIGLIGAGGMGVEDAKTALQHPNVKITAVATFTREELMRQKSAGEAVCLLPRITKNY
jgi:predicted homoserine dehydrogenase-like protein